MIQSSHLDIRSKLLSLIMKTEHQSDSIAVNVGALHRWGISIPSARYKSPIELLITRYNKMLNRNRPAETEFDQGYEAEILFVAPTFAKPLVSCGFVRRHYEVFLITHSTSPAEIVNSATLSTR